MIDQKIHRVNKLLLAVRKLLYQPILNLNLNDIPIDFSSDYMLSKFYDVYLYRLHFANSEKIHFIFGCETRC